MLIGNNIVAIKALVKGVEVGIIKSISCKEEREKIPLYLTLGGPIVKLVKGRRIISGTVEFESIKDESIKEFEVIIRYKDKPPTCIYRVSLLDETNTTEKDKKYLFTASHIMDALK